MRYQKVKSTLYNIIQTYVLQYIYNCILRKLYLYVYLHVFILSIQFLIIRLWDLAHTRDQVTKTALKLQFFFNIPTWQPVGLAFLYNTQNNVTLELSTNAKPSSINEYIFGEKKSFPIRWVKYFPSHTVTIELCKLLNKFLLQKKYTIIYSNSKMIVQQTQPIITIFIYR